jgi:TPR repeat protein
MASDEWKREDREARDCRRAGASPRPSARYSPLASRLSTFSVLALFLLAASPASAARGDRSLHAGVAAYNRQAYVVAASIFIPLGERGNVQAATYLGFMYAHGWGVPQNYEISARWYELAARRGEPVAQYQLGLMCDKGQGVPQDYIAAYAWLSLAVAQAKPRDREYWTRIRDAVGSKLSLADLTSAQRLTAEWDPARR